MSKRTKEIEFMSNVAEDIIKKCDGKKNNYDIKKRWKIFIKIMKKYGIQPYTKVKGGGLIGNNFEWTLCVSLFKDLMYSDILLTQILDLPETFYSNFNVDL